MKLLINTWHKHHFKQIGLILLMPVILLYSYVLIAEESSIRFEQFKFRESGERSYLADIQLRYQLTQYLNKSLREGVTIIGEIEITLVKRRPFWKNKNISLARIRSTLQYHALSQHFQVIRQDTNEYWNFKSLNTALKKMGLLHAYRLPKLTEKINSGKYHIEVSANLRPKTFKFPMKIHSIFVDKYKMKTPGVQWPLP